MKAKGVKNKNTIILEGIMMLESSNFTSMYYKLVGEDNNNTRAILK